MVNTCASYDNRFTLAQGRLHLSFQLGGKWIAYAYIRKNACSAFKCALGFAWNTDIAEVAARHPYQPGRRHDAAIFVYRDPLERLVSLYKSKVLEQRGARGLLASYRAVMQEEPSSFERFVEFAVLERDPHCWTQRSHLARMKYLAIPLHGLHEGLVSIVGSAAAEPFKTKVNDSEAREVEVSARAKAIVRTHYAEDYALVEALGRKVQVLTRLRAGRRRIDGAIERRAAAARLRARRAVASVWWPHSLALLAPVFVLGNQKAGTTAFAALLGAAAKLDVTHDFLYLTDPGQWADVATGRRSFDSFVQQHLPQFCRPIVKDNQFTFWTRDLKRLFPRARFVAIVRDPRENIRSILDRLAIPGDLDALTSEHERALEPLPFWRHVLRGEHPKVAGDGYIEVLAHRWVRCVQEIHGACAPAQVLRYEDFVRDKRAAVEAILGGLGIPVRADVSPMTERRFQPEGRRGRSWEEVFGAKNLATIEAICAPHMRQLGYQLSGP